MAEQLWRYPGARWWKFDFHTHTPASLDYGKGHEQSRHREISPVDWLLAYMRAEVDCVAVTDHNSGGWIDRLTEAYAQLEVTECPDFRPLHLFPGVEITANGGVHILAILDPAMTAADVLQLLGRQVLWRQGHKRCCSRRLTKGSCPGDCAIRRYSSSGTRGQAFRCIRSIEREHTSTIARYSGFVCD